MSVFGAFNRFISRLDADTQSRSLSLGRGAFGFQVLRNKNYTIPIEPWYDFLVGINGRQIVSVLGILCTVSLLTMYRMIQIPIFSQPKCATVPVRA